MLRNNKSKKGKYFLIKKFYYKAIQIKILHRARENYNRHLRTQAATSGAVHGTRISTPETKNTDLAGGDVSNLKYHLCVYTDILHVCRDEFSDFSYSAKFRTSFGCGFQLRSNSFFHESRLLTSGLRVFAGNFDGFFSSSSSSLVIVSC